MIDDHPLLYSIESSKRIHRIKNSQIRANERSRRKDVILVTKELWGILTILFPKVAIPDEGDRL